MFQLAFIHILIVAITGGQTPETLTSNYIYYNLHSRDQIIYCDDQLRILIYIYICTKCN